MDTPECKQVATLNGMKEFSYPTATWAIFEANGELPDAIQKIYKQFYSEWLPNKA